MKAKLLTSIAGDNDAGESFSYAYGDEVTPDQIGQQTFAGLCDSGQAEELDKPAGKSKRADSKKPDVKDK